MRPNKEIQYCHFPPRFNQLIVAMFLALAVSSLGSFACFQGVFLKFVAACICMFCLPLLWWHFRPHHYIEEHSFPQNTKAPFTQYFWVKTQTLSSLWSVFALECPKSEQYENGLQSGFANASESVVF